MPVELNIASSGGNPIRIAAPERVVPPRKLRLDMRLMGIAKGLGISYADSRLGCELSFPCKRSEALCTSSRVTVSLVTEISGGRIG